MYLLSQRKKVAIWLQLNKSLMLQYVLLGIDMKYYDDAILILFL